MHGADEIYSGEEEVALAITDAVLRELGATPEQIDRERDRVWAKLFGGPPAVDPQPPITPGPLQPVPEEGAAKQGPPQPGADGPKRRVLVCRRTADQRSSR